MINEKLQALTGSWAGTNRLNLSWLEDPIRESNSTAVVRLNVSGQCLTIEYTWEYENEAQEGILIVCPVKDSDKVNAVWTDSWHSSHVLMNCTGTSDADGKIDVKGLYSVPGYPDWGWRTVIETNGDSFRYLMFNVTPEGEEEWATETEFKRL